MKKVKLRIDRGKVTDALYRAERTIEYFNDLKDYYEEIEVDLPTEILKKFVERELSESVIDEYVNNQFTDQNKYNRKLLRGELKKDLMSYPARIYNSSFEYVAFNEQCRAVLKENAEEEMTERYTIYLTNPKTIERYQRHEKLLKEANELLKEIKVFNPHLFATPGMLFQTGENETIVRNEMVSYGD